MKLRRVKREEILLSVNVKHSIEGGSAEYAARSIDLLQSSEGIEVDFIRAYPHDGTIFLVQGMNSPGPARLQVFVCKTPSCQSIEWWTRYGAERVDMERIDDEAI
jgi:hypothetical protein